MTKIYLAGPLFTLAEREFNTRLVVSVHKKRPDLIEDNTRNGILRTLSYFLRLSQVVPIKPSPKNSTGTRIPSRQYSGSFIDSFKWDIFDVWQYSFKN